MGTNLGSEAEVLGHAVLSRQLNPVVVSQRDVAYIADGAYMD